MSHWSARAIFLALSLFTQYLIEQAEEPYLWVIAILAPLETYFWFEIFFYKLCRRSKGWHAFFLLGPFVTMGFVFLFPEAFFGIQAAVIAWVPEWIQEFIQSI